MFKLYNTAIFILLIIFLAKCKSNTKATQDLGKDSSIVNGKPDSLLSQKDKKYTDRNDSLHHMGTPVGNNIIGRWKVEGSAGDVVLEFTFDGKYKLTAGDEKVTQGTYYFDESRSFLEMSGKGESQVKIEGERMTQKGSGGGTMVYKRLQ